MKETKQIIKVGMTIPFIKEDILIDKTYTERMSNLEMGMDSFTGAMRVAHEDFWKNIRALHPELDDWEFILDRKSKTIQVTRPKFKES